MPWKIGRTQTRKHRTFRLTHRIPPGESGHSQWPRHTWGKAPMSHTGYTPTAASPPSSCRPHQWPGSLHGPGRFSPSPDGSCLCQRSVRYRRSRSPQAPLPQQPLPGPGPMPHPYNKDHPYPSHPFLHHTRKDVVASSALDFLPPQKDITAPVQRKGKCVWGKLALGNV